jgi:hypothetical protein
MSIRPNKTFLSVFLLFLFLAIRGLSYHPITHAGESNQINCELCDLVLLSELTPVLNSAPPAYEIPFTTVIVTTSAIGYTDFPGKPIAKACLFSRPPPFFI